MSTIYIRGDQLVIRKLGGNAELTLENATRDTLGYLYNTGGGVTEFRAVTPGAAEWGTISGDITDQTDLMTMFATKQDTLVSGVNIRTVNGNTLLGSTDLVISGSISDGDKGDITVTGSGATWTVDNTAITFAKMQNISANRVMGRVLPGSGVATELTGADITPLLSVFTASTPGIVPLSGGGTSNYLRADGTWAAPSGGGGVSDGDKGDITVSSGGATWTIDLLAVGDSKISDVAWSKITGAPTIPTVDLVLADGSTNAISNNAVFDGLATKQATLVSGVNIKTINGSTILGSGDLVISGTISDGDKTDITVSGSGTVFTIDNLAVTNAKINDVAWTKITGVPDAAADGVTKGVATFAANDFNAFTGLISIDYTNGQAATSSTKGFLTSANWTTFNAKQTLIAGTMTNGYVATVVAGVATWAASAASGGESLDATLAIGDTTGRKQIFVHNPASNDIIRYITPNNYGTTYSGYGVGGRFSEIIGRADVNASGRPNIGYTLGYNTIPGGGRENTSEASMAIAWETHYESGGGQLLELHIPQVIDVAGGIHRMQSWTINKADGSNTLYFTTNSFDFRDPAGALAQPYFASGESGQLQIYGPGASFDMVNTTYNTLFRIENSGDVNYKNFNLGHIFYGNTLATDLLFRLFYDGEIYFKGLDNGYSATQMVATNNGLLSIQNLPVSGITSGQVGFGIGPGTLSGEDAFVYDSTTNILTVPLIKLTSGSPGAGKVLTSDADGDATWETPTGGSLTDGDKGDITVSSSGAVWTIDNLAVTNAKINDVAWGKVTGITGTPDGTKFLRDDGSWQTTGGGGTTETASNGLTKVTNDIQLGGTLAAGTTIDTSTFNLNVIGTSASNGSLNIANTGNGPALIVSSVNGIPAHFTYTFSTTSSSEGIFKLTRATTGTAAAGIGGSMSFDVETSDGTNQTAGEIAAKWTTATTGSRSSVIEFYGANSAATDLLVSFAGNGEVTLHGYDAAVSGTAAFDLAVTSAGKIITVAAGGGGGGVTTLAAIGSTPNANAATISGTTLNMQPSSHLFGGVNTAAFHIKTDNKTPYWPDSIIRTQQTSGLPPQSSLAAIDVTDATDYSGYPTLLKDRRGRLHIFHNRGSSHTATDFVIKHLVSSDGGASFETLSNLSIVQASAGEVHATLLSNGKIGVTFGDMTVTPSNYTIYYTESDDDGETFSSPVTIHAPVNDPAQQTDILEDRNVIYVPVYTKLGADTRTSVIVYRSYDWGKTWASPVTIASAPSTTNYNESRIVRWKNSLVFFVRDETGGKLWRSVSTNGGTTWGSLTDVTPPSYVVSEPDPIVVGNMLMLHYRSTGAMHRAVSYDGGLTWDDDEVADTTATTGGAVQYSTTIFEDGLFITAYGMDAGATFGTDAKVKLRTYYTGSAKGLDGTLEGAAGGGVPSLTAGSVVFSGGGTTLSQDNANFFWDNTNNRLGIGTASPIEALHVTGGMQIGDALSGWGSPLGNGKLTVSNSTTSSSIFLGQSATAYGGIGWFYNATEASASMGVGTVGANELVLQLAGGKTVVTGALKIGNSSTAGYVWTATDTVGNGSWQASAAGGTTINNNADNRIITGSGTANTLNGESLFAYDGTTISVTTANSTGLKFTEYNANYYGVYAQGIASPSSTPNSYALLVHKSGTETYLGATTSVHLGISATDELIVTSGLVTVTNLKITVGTPSVGWVWTCTNVDGSGEWAAAAGGGSSKWTDTGSDIYRNSSVMIGSTSAPIEKLDVRGGIQVGEPLASWGSPLGSGKITISNTANHSALYLGQSATGYGAITWSYNATEASAFMGVTTGGANELRLQTSSGKTVIVGALKLSAAGTPGAGKILTSDADGDATWETPTAGNFIAMASIVSQVGIANTETVVVYRTLGANTLQTGTCIKVKGWCSQSGTNAATPTIRVRIGTSTLSGAIAATLTGAVGTSAVPSHFEALVTIRTITSSGTAIGGITQFKSAVAVASNALTATVTVNSTVSNLCEFTFISGHASNTYNFQVCEMEVINPTTES